jgi:hypothetical protein
VYILTDYDEMNKTINFVVSALLLINAVAALYGGLNFILRPDGSSMHMSLDWLKHTPFHDYLIPGIILLIANGIFSVGVLIAIILRIRLVTWLIMAQGTVLLGWISVQVLMIKIINFHHFVFVSIGIVLIITGWQLKRQIHDNKGEEG